MLQAQVYVQTISATGVVQDADLVAASRAALLCHVKVTGQAARTAGSLTIETQAGTVLHAIEVGAGTYVNLHESLSIPVKSNNGLKLNADNTLTGPIVITIGYQ